MEADAGATRVLSSGTGYVMTVDDARRRLESARLALWVAVAFLVVATVASLRGAVPGIPDWLAWLGPVVDLTVVVFGFRGRFLGVQALAFVRVVAGLALVVVGAFGFPAAFWIGSLLVLVNSMFLRVFGRARAAQMALRAAGGERLPSGEPGIGS